jgi:adenylate kinase
LVLLGAPGSGKGTQAALLKAKYACAHISTGDILRQNLKDGTELGLQAKGYMDKGELVPDGLVIKMARERLREDDAVRSGFLMDGFPRTLPQAEAFEEILEELGRPLDAVLLLSIDEEALIRRLSNRRTCRACGRIENLLSMTEKPMPEGGAAVCPACGGELHQRDDDTESVIRNRLKVYHDQTAPLVSWYEAKKKLRVVDASGSPEEILRKIQAVLG